MTFLRSRRRVIGVLLGIVATLLVAWAALATFAHPRTASISPAVRRAQSAVKSMFTQYYNRSLGLLAELPTPPQAAQRTATPGKARERPAFAPVTLWGYSWALAAVEDVAQLPGGAHYLPTVRRLANNLVYYWDAGAAIPAYAPTVNPGPGANKFYDDNAWAGLDLITAYHLTQDPKYLQRAEEVFRYLESGWDPVKGGIYWNDQRVTRNTASTAPTAELAVYLYRETNDGAYLTWAKKLYFWEVTNLVDRKTGQVWGNIDDSSNIQHRMWTYNQGTVIGAGVLLYQETHEKSYLSQAKRTAAYVLRSAEQPGGAFVPQAEFNGVLVDNLQLLYGVTRSKAIRSAIATNSRLAWSRARNKQGLVGWNWEGPPPQTAKHPLLAQTGAVRLFAVAAALAQGGFPDRML